MKFNRTYPSRVFSFRFSVFSSSKANCKLQTVNSLLNAVALTTLLMCVSEKASAQPNAQNDIFAVLRNSCNNYLNVTANDNLDTLPVSLLQIITQPANGTAFTNGNFLSYCPFSNFQGADFFQYSVTAAGSTDTATVYLNVLPPNNKIYAGDADENGTVQHFDVLTIGLAFGAQGSSRDSLSNGLAWQPIPFINTDPGAADCNGDGVIDSADVAVIENFYRDTFPVLKPYTVDTSICDASGISFFIESLSGDSLFDGDTLIVSIRLGESAVLNEAYGIAFTLEFDNRFVGGSQVQFSTDNSWLIQNDTPLFFKKDFQQTGEFEIALSKTNHIIANGGGEILSAIFPIDDNIDGIAVAPGWHDFKLNLTKVRLISEYDIVRDVCVEQPSIRVNKTTTGIAQRENRIEVYPNPSSGKIYVTGNNLQEIILTDVAGKTVFHSAATGNRMDMKTDFTQGVYFITIRTRDGVITKKLFIQP